MTEVKLLPLEASDREQFILDNQEAFNYGALEEFGRRDDHFEADEQIISRETVEQSCFADRFKPSTPQSPPASILLRVIPQAIVAAPGALGDRRRALVAYVMKSLHIRLVQVADAQHSLLRAELLCQLMIGAGEDIHAVHVRGF